MRLTFLRDDAAPPEISEGAINSDGIGPRVAALTQAAVAQQQPGLAVPENSVSVRCAGAPTGGSGVPDILRTGRKLRRGRVEEGKLSVWHAVAGQPVPISLMRSTQITSVDDHRDSDLCRDRAFQFAKRASGNVEPPPFLWPSPDDHAMNLRKIISSYRDRSEPSAGGVRK